MCDFEFDWFVDIVCFVVCIVLDDDYIDVVFVRVFLFDGMYFVDYLGVLGK